MVRPRICFYVLREFLFLCESARVLIVTSDSYVKLYNHVFLIPTLGRITITVMYGDNDSGKGLAVN